jgi:hypothetical protein
MAVCWRCAYPLSSAARFCRSCGADQAARPRSGLHRAEWYSLDHVMASPNARLGALGIALIFIGAFTPWASYGLSLWGFTIGYVGIGSPQAWLTALGAVVAAILLFHRGAGRANLAIGVIVAIWTAIFAITVLSQGGSPSVGPLLTLVGAGLLAYSAQASCQRWR